MDRALLDALRCPAPHPEEWLVAMVHHAEGPALREADLACPACGAAYAVRHGIAWFREAPAEPPAAEPPAAEPSAAEPSAAEPALGARTARHDGPDHDGHAPDADGADRLAALLGVAEGPWPVLLAGRRAAEGAALAARVTPPQWWLNPAPAPPVDPARLAAGLDAVLHAVLHAVLYAGPRWPLAARVVAAVALDAAHATPEHLAEAARVLRPGGRLLAPAAAPLPPGLRELARDDAEWIAEKGGAGESPAGGLVALRRRGG